MKLEPVIGLEIHVQLKTQSKMFCACANGAEAAPNSMICPICMGHPGTLPVPNGAAVEMAVRAILALNGTVNERSVFARKHYFYPDLPKGYQISQYDEPIGDGGWLDIETSPPALSSKERGRVTRRIHLVRLHLEEDAAKLTHSESGKETQRAHPATPDLAENRSASAATGSSEFGVSTDTPHSSSPVSLESESVSAQKRVAGWALVDFNRAGSPLAEIVTQPEFRTPEEAKEFLTELQLLLRALQVSDADMEKGQMRCDANISMRPTNTTTLSPKIEVKNLNSISAVGRALAYEIQRQTKLWEAGTPPATQETRGWNDRAQATELQRTKEAAHDYRYFPDPDIPPLVVTAAAIAVIRRRLPELPQAMRARFIAEYAMDVSDARILTGDRALAAWTEHMLSELRAWLGALEGEGTAEEKWETGKKKIVKLATGWVTSKLFALMAEAHLTIAELKITPENFAEFIALLSARKMNSTVGQEVLQAMVATGVDPSNYLDEKGLAQVEDTGAIEAAVRDVIAAHPDIVASYKNGKTSVLQFLIGQVMKITQGRANPETVSDCLIKKLITSSS